MNRMSFPRRTGLRIPLFTNTPFATIYPEILRPTYGGTYENESDQEVSDIQTLPDFEEWSESLESPKFDSSTLSTCSSTDSVHDEIPSPPLLVRTTNAFQTTLTWQVIDNSDDDIRTPTQITIPIDSPRAPMRYRHIHPLENMIDVQPQQNYNNEDNDNEINYENDEY